jgi:predicted ester cyclase
VGAAENLATHLRWAEADDRHDLSHHHEFIHDDIVVHHLDGEDIVGLAALVANMEASLAAMPDYKVTIDDRFATHDRVVCRWRVSGVPLGGAPVEVAGISVWQFEDGKARRGWVCSNAAALEQRGVQNAHAYSLQAHEPR